MSSSYLSRPLRTFDQVLAERKLTIMSQDGRHKAVVTEDADGPVATYFRLMYDDSRGRADDLRPVWRKLRTSSMRMSFHAALDVVHGIVDQF